MTDGRHDWRYDALCAQVDADIMFPDKTKTETLPAIRSSVALQVCALCPVRATDLGGSGECLEYALEHGERFGVWGGKTERERRRISRERGIAGTRPRRHNIEPQEIPRTLAVPARVGRRKRGNRGVA